jgi:peptidoglycan/LPS O-acetylase OafA/YrhL
MHMTTIPKGGAGMRLPSLTGVRFVAAALVFAFHAAYEFPFRDTAIGSVYSQVVAKSGQVGVGFFFVLSGFVLTWTARPTDTPRKFWRRRLVKIYPNHFLTWAAALVLMLITGQAVLAGSALPNLFLVHAWVPKANVLFSMDDVSWTLACEALFYLSFPWLHSLVRRVQPERLWLWAGIVVGVVLVVPLIAQLLPDRPVFVDTSIWRVWFVYSLPPVRALDFLLGIVMARIVMTGKWIRIGLLPAAGLVVVGYLVALYGPHLYSFVGATIIPLALLIPAAAVADVNGTTSPLRGRVMVWLGEVSFAFYLVHRLVLQYGHIALGAGRTWSTPTAIGLLLLGLALSMLLAWLLHAGVERPMMRRFASARRARVSTVVDPDARVLQP